MARQLKVFCYSDGFHSWTVAASSRAKALEAWGVKRDLFKDGAAKEIDIGPDRAAALAAPGELIERGLAVDIGQVERTTAPKAKKAKASDAKAKALVGTLEAELGALDLAQAEEAAAAEAERAALEQRIAALAKRQATVRDALKAKLKAARAKLS
ncbi:MAG: hypothetical protein ACK4JY_06170 [Brevundimonas sp.]|uniref:hypothetical protein n=1 Tax=Brevundimonas sp. TaxID=1871086 RepID=UPI00391DDCFA